MENRNEQDQNRGTRIEVRTGTATVPRTYVSPEAGQERAEAAAQEVKQEAEEAGEALRERASEMAERVGESTRSMFDQRKGQVAEGLHDLAGAFRRAGDQLRMEDKASVASYTDRLAEQVDRFSQSLQDKSTEELVNDVEDFARERPEIFLGGAFLLGLLAARVLKGPSRSYTGRTQPSRPYSRYGSVVERESRSGQWTPGRMPSGEEVR